MEASMPIMDAQPFATASLESADTAMVAALANPPVGYGAVKSQRAPYHVTLNDIRARRAKAGKLVALTAAYSDSDMFKAPTGGKPKAKHMDHHLTDESVARKPCILKQAAHHLKKPGLISLGGGLPAAANFPFGSLSFRTADPRHGFSEEATDAAGREICIGKYDATDARVDGVYDLAVSLNYCQATGSAQLLRWVTEHTELVGAPPYADWRCCLTVGSTGALEQALRMLCDKARGDSVLTEEFSFSTALETAWPLGIPMFGAPMDEEGLLPEAMDQLLSEWDAAARGARKPHVLYTVPSGQNPTGATMGLQRKRDVYEVARKHDVYVLEDEPYYFLQMPPHVPGAPLDQQASAPTTVDAFLSSLIPSVLSIDTDGRVMRMDSFSKVMVPGSRVGWITASARMIERFVRHAEVCNQGPAGFSQLILYKLLDETWGHEGYFRWLMHLQTQYAKRRNVMVAACAEFLPRHLVRWHVPAAGMFFWLHLRHETHPDLASRGILGVEEAIFNLCIAKGVLVARGSWFQAEKGMMQRAIFFRATFASATEEHMREAVRRFGEAVRESYHVT